MLRLITGENNKQNNALKKYEQLHKHYNINLIYIDIDSPSSAVVLEIVMVLTPIL